MNKLFLCYFGRIHEILFYMDIIKKYTESRNKLFEQEGIKPSSKFVSTNGPVKKVHYLELGTGEPLVIVHGGLSHSSEWINILKPLANNFHLYVVDRPGHGLTDPINYRGVDYRRSAVEFLLSFLDATELQQPLLMANSMGGYFSICFAMEYPERVKKLLLIGAPAGVNLWIPPMLRLLGIKGINWLMMKTVAKPSISGVKNIHKQLLVANVNKLSNCYLENSYYNQLLPGSETSFCTLLESVLTYKGWRKELYLGDLLNQLKVPVYFIWGDKDAFEKPETGRLKASSIKNMTFEVVSDAGHCPWFDQPEKCCELIILMLKD